METHPPPTSPYPVRLDDEAETSSLSDYDSEWTQVSQSEDESDMRCASRSEDSISHQDDTDSVGGDAWEGLLDDTFTSVVDDHPGLTDSIIAAVEADEDSSHFATAVPNDDDCRVKAGLESSMTGTLEAVRARSLTSSFDGTASTTSQSKLRLSFPDPLSRSDDDFLMDTVEALVPGTDSLPKATGDVVDSTATVTVSEPQPLESINQKEETKVTNARGPVSLSIVLYGARSPSRWSVAEKVMNLALNITDEHLSYEAVGCTRIYQLNKPQSEGPLVQEVRVIDTNSEPRSITPIPAGASIAVVFLPIATFVPSSHSLYLPIVSQPCQAHEQGVRPFHTMFAAKTWATLGISEEKVVKFSDQWGHSVIDETIFMQKSPSEAAGKFAALLNPTPARSDRAARLGEMARQYGKEMSVWVHGVLDVAAQSNLPRSLLLASVFAVGILATTWRSFVPFEQGTSHSVTSTPVQTATSTINSSTVVKVITTSHEVAPLSLKDFAVAVVVPSTTALSLSRPVSIITTVAQKPARDESHTQTPTYCSGSQCSQVQTTDVITRPPSSIDTIEKLRPRLHVTPSPAAKGADDGDADGKQLSIRIYTSLSTVLSNTGLAEIFAKEIQVIYEEVDMFLKALAHYAKIFEGNWQEAKHAFVLRNNRARVQAKQLKDIGLRFLSSAGAVLQQNVVNLRGAMGHARRRARTQRSRTSHTVEQLIVDSGKQGVPFAHIGDVVHKKLNRGRKMARRMLKHRRCGGHEDLKLLNVDEVLGNVVGRLL